MVALRRRLASQGLTDIVYLVVNHQGAQAQHLHALLAERLSEGIVLYGQQEEQPDVWQTLGGEKDDFFIYDRCGRLTHHVSLPYSVIGHGHVEKGIKEAYCKRVCGECTHESAETPEACKETADAPPDGDGPRPVEEEDTGHGRHHRHRHGHGGQGGNRGGNHGHRHGSRNGGHEHGQQGVRQPGQVQDDGAFQRQQHFDVGQMQQQVHMLQMPQEPVGGPAGP